MPVATGCLIERPGDRVPAEGVVPLAHVGMAVPRTSSRARPWCSVIVWTPVPALAAAHALSTPAAMYSLNVIVLR